MDDRRRLLINIGMPVLLVLIVVVGVVSTLRLIPDDTGSVPTMDPTPSVDGTSSPTAPPSDPVGPATSGTGARTVRLGGATTENLFPQASKSVADPIGCLLLYNNQYLVPVSILDVRIETDSGPADLELGGTGACELSPCLGLDLPPRVISGERLECMVEIHVPPVPGEYHGYVFLELHTVCDRSDVAPCSRVPAPPPSEASPVDVRWTVSQEIFADNRPPDSPDEEPEPTDTPPPTVPAPTTAPPPPEEEPADG
jgi:hypothetical protein